MLALARVDPRKFVEVGNLAGNLNRKFGWIKARYALDSTPAIQKSAAESLLALTVRTDNAHAGDHDAWSHFVEGLGTRFLLTFLKDI